MPINAECFWAIYNARSHSRQCVLYSDDVHKHFALLEIVWSYFFVSSFFSRIYEYQRFDKVPL